MEKSKNSRSSGERIFSALYLFITLSMLLAFITGDISFRIAGIHLRWSRTFSFLAWLAATFPLGYLLHRRSLKLSDLFGSDNPWLPAAPVAAMVLLMSSGFRLDQWYFFLKPSVGLLFLVLCLPLALVLRWLQRKEISWILPLLLLAIQVYLAWTLFRSTGGEPIYRDDHASFMYRFWILARSFPRLIHYNPLWNAGYVGTELVSTGTLSLGLFALPFLSFLKVEVVYLPFLIFVFFILIPWLTWLAVRSLGFSGFSAWAAAVLSLGTNRFFFVNLLTYGTIPSLFVSFLLMITGVILYRLINNRKKGPLGWLLLVLSLNLMIFYPPSLFMLSPLIFSFLLSLKRINKRAFFFLAAAALALAILNGWWIFDYLRQPQVLAFAAAAVGHGEPFQLGRAMHSLSGAVKQTNPLLLVAGLFGLIWPAGKKEALWFLPPALALMIMIAVGPQVKPHLQLQRMIIPLSFWLIVPAASAINRLTLWTGPGPSMIGGVVAALALLTVFNVGDILNHKGMETFWPMKPYMKEMAGWLMENVPVEGRVFFAGETVHGYGGGHVAYLQAMTGRSMIAGDYYHFDPRIVDYNPVPGCFRGTDEGRRRYFELFGITHIATFHRGWKDYLGCREEYRLAGRFDEKEIYETGVEPGLLLRGEGVVRARINTLEVDLAGPAEEVVLRLIWHEGLKAEAPVEIGPEEVAPGVFFIRARPGGATSFLIHYDP